MLRDYNAAVVKVPASVLLLKCNHLSVVTGTNISHTFCNCCPCILMVHITLTKLGCVDETVFEQKCFFFSEVWSLTHLHTLPLISQMTVKASRPLPFQHDKKKKERFFC